MQKSIPLLDPVFETRSICSDWRKSDRALIFSLAVRCQVAEYQRLDALNARIAEDNPYNGGLFSDFSRNAVPLPFVDRKSLLRRL